MKTMNDFIDTPQDNILQQKIDNLTDDLFNVVEKHLNHFDEEILFNIIFQYYTYSLYALLNDDALSYNILRMGMHEGKTDYENDKGMGKI